MNSLTYKMMKRLPKPPQKYQTFGPKNEGLSGWKLAGVFGGVVGFMALFLWPILIDPTLNVDRYKIKREMALRQLREAGFDPDEMRPGQLAPWTDPFKRESRKKHD